MKLLGATIALGTAVLLAEATTMALDAGLWWLVSLTAVAFWPFVAVAVALIWSAGRQEPRPSLITMPDQLNPAERDAWAELERRLGDGR